MIRPNLENHSWAAFAAPESIALVGASEKITGVSFTNRFLANNRQLGYRGDIHLVNPARETIFGQPCLPELSALDEPPAAVIVNVPAVKVQGIVDEAIAVGARAIMVHSGGFAEAGPQGLRLQEQMAQSCARAGIGLIGPNCLGLVSVVGSTSLYGSPLPSTLQPGPLCAITQSGSVASTFLGLGGEYGMSFLASTGNESVTTMEDLLERAVEDDQSRVIVLFLETVRQPERFRRAALRAAEVGKKIVVLKVGRTSQGGKVSRGHTGATAGSGDVYRQAFAQFGALEVEDFDELEQTVRLLLRLRQKPGGDRVAILGTSGGKLAAVTDTAVELGIELSPLTDPTLARIRDALNLPDGVEPQNPLDVGIGFRSKRPYGERFQECLKAVASDSSVDLVAVMQDLSSDDRQRSLNDEIVEAVADEAQRLAKPVVLFSCHAVGASPELVARASELGLPVMTGARASLRAIRHLTRPPAVPPSRVDPAPAPLTDTAKNRSLPGGALPQPRVFDLLASHGLPVVSLRPVASAQEAVDAVRDLGAPVVMKLDSPTVIHKSDVGGVVLDISDEEGARAAFKALQNVPAGGAERRVVVSPQLGAGLELFAGATWDDTFGPVIAFGLGGRLVEFLSRTALAVSPSSAEQFIDLIERSGLLPLLRGYRGGPVADLDALVHTLGCLTELAVAVGPRLEAIDLNPIIINPQHAGGCIVDARILIAEDDSRG